MARGSRFGREPISGKYNWIGIDTLEKLTESARCRPLKRRKSKTSGSFEIWCPRIDCWGCRRPCCRYRHTWFSASRICIRLYPNLRHRLRGVFKRHVKLLRHDSPVARSLVWERLARTAATSTQETTLCCDGSECGKTVVSEDGELELLPPHWHITERGKPPEFRPPLLCGMGRVKTAEAGR